MLWADEHYLVCHQKILTTNQLKLAGFKTMKFLSFYKMNSEN